MPDPVPLPGVKVLVDGGPLAKDTADQLDRVVVDLSARAPGAVALTFRGQTPAMPAELGLAVGSEVSVESAEADGVFRPLITAEVTSLEADFGPLGVVVVVRGYDVRHRLTRGRRSRVFVTVTDDDIVRKVLGEAGVRVGRLDKGGVVHEHVLQARSSDWDFLQDRARRSGHELRCSGKAVDLVPVTAKETVSVAVVLGEQLSSFRPRQVATAQVASAAVHGWDVKAKKTVSAVASTHATPLGRTLGGAFGKVERDAGDRVVRVQGEATARAKAALGRTEAVATEADGVLQGDPRLLPGVRLDVTGLGKPFDGSYRLSRTRHVLDRTGYRTEVEVGGEDRSLLALSGSGRSARPPGLVVGVVTQNEDLEGLGRVKVSYPWLGGQLESDWARVAMPGAGADRGLVLLPEVNDEVLVAFEHDDVDAPYVIGQLWNGKDRTPDGKALVAQRKVGTRELVSRLGHRLVLDDTDAKKSVRLSTSAGHSLLLDDAGKRVVLTSARGQVLELHDDGRVVLKGSGAVTVEAMQVKVDAKTSIALEAKGPLTLKGATVSLEATGVAQVKAAGVLALQGALVKIN